MPRHKGLLKGGGPGAGRPSGSKKIVIKPFRKPPALPANYYETTAAGLLRGTLSVLKSAAAASSSSSATAGGPAATVTATTTTPPAEDHAAAALSLQNSYTAVVHLVSHQYGPRLYADLRDAMQQAAAICLPDDRADVSNTAASGLLSYVPAQYQLYTDYLLLCRSVFLPLDRTHYWLSDANRAVSTTKGSGGCATAATATAAHQSSSSPSPSSSAGATATTTGCGGPAAAAGAGGGACLNIWQVGLQQFAARLRALHLDERLYREWLTALLQDWNPEENHHVAGAAGTAGSTAGAGGKLITTGTAADRRPLLQAVWYLWQDLGFLSVLPLHADLQRYWKRQSVLYQQRQQPYRASHFLSWAAAKHGHALTWSPWLPVRWLHRLVETQLFQPHLNDQYLLATDNLYPMLTEQVFHNTASSGSTAMMSAQRESSSEHQHAPSSSSPVQQLWMLAGRLPGGQASVAAAIAEYARAQGLQRVRNHGGGTAGTGPQQPQPHQQQQQAVSDLLQLQDCLHRLIATLPAGAESIQLKSVWEEVVNSDRAKPCLAEQLAKYLDSVLRSTKKMDLQQQQYCAGGAGSDAVTGAGAAAANMMMGPDRWLSKIISGLFVPLAAKDVFEAFYKRDLAKRLLWNRVVSMDVEKRVCSLLKAECGAGYTSKMEGMFQDVDWSRETMMVYKQSLQGGGAGAAGSGAGSSSTSATTTSSSVVEMEVQVLTTGYWPVYPQYPALQLPAALKTPQEAFAAHYKQKYQGRRMTWQYALGHCQVKCTGFHKPYDLVVSLCQAMVLLQFNEQAAWTLPALLAATGLDDRDEMERILLSLSLGKDGTRILRKRDVNNNAAAAAGGKQTAAAAPAAAAVKKTRHSVSDADEFRVNSKFESNQRRIRITNIMMRETAVERQKTVAAVSRDRLYLIDAVLVRILKARKTILHQQLIPAVLEQLKVPATAADVKKRVESLIERDYMERCAKDRNRYNYLA